MAADGSIVFTVDADDREAEKKLNQLRRDIEKTAKSLDESFGKQNSLVEQLEAAREEIAKTQKEIETLTAERLETQNALKGMEENGEKGSEDYLAAQQVLKEQNYQINQQIHLRDKLNATVAKLQDEEMKNAGVIASKGEQLDSMQEQAGILTERLTQSQSILPQIKSAVDGVSKSLRKGVKSILRWGFGIRSAFILMRRLRSAIKEGIKTFAQYDEETKLNVRHLKNSMEELKVSWGAAFAGLFNAAAPILQRIINLLIQAANYVQMFFAVLGGAKTYKKVIANNEALTDSYNSAGGAAKEAQKQVMGFDELNKLDDNSGGGGGGGAKSAITGVDEEAIPQGFIDKVDWVKDNFEAILGIATLIGTALLAWKISKMLGTPFLATLKTIIGLIMAIAGAVVLVKNWLDAWNNGVDWGNLIGMLAGATVMAVGLGIAFGTTATAIGLLVAGVAFLVLGFKEWIETGELSTQTFTLIEAGLLAIGVAIALLTGSWIPLLIAAIAGIVVAVIKYWDEIKAFTLKVWNAVKDAVGGALDKVSEKIQAFKTKVSETFDRIAAKATELKDKFVEKFNAIRDKAHEIIEKVKEFFSFHWELPHIRLPHLTVSWQPAGDIGRFFGFQNIPHLGIEWYAKGGVIDRPTIIGAGEAGREAVVPLERNTEWISVVAEELIDRLTSGSRVADLVSKLGIPALANGQIIPPRAIGGGGIFSDGDIDKLISGITTALTGGEYGEHTTNFYLDGRKFAEVVTKHQREMARGGA